MLIIQIGELGGREAGHKVAQECAPGTCQGFSRWGGGVGIIQSRVNAGFARLYILSLIFHYRYYLYFMLFLGSYTLNMTI